MCNSEAHYVYLWRQDRKKCHLCPLPWGHISPVSQWTDEYYCVRTCCAVLNKWDAIALVNHLFGLEGVNWLSLPMFSFLPSISKSLFLLLCVSLSLLYVFPLQLSVCSAGKKNHIGSLSNPYQLGGKNWPRERGTSVTLAVQMYIFLTILTACALLAEFIGGIVITVYLLKKLQRNNIWSAWLCLSYCAMRFSTTEYSFGD